MKRILSILILAMTVTVVFGGPIDYHRARQIAQDFINQQRASVVEVAYVEENPGAAVNVIQGNASRQPAYYAFNAVDGEGFVLVASDDAFPQVLGYSDTGRFGVGEEMPHALRRMLDNFEAYASDIHLGLVDAPDVEAKRRQTDYKEVAALIDSKWTQSSPYNLHIPKVNGRPGYVGCVGLAMAQIMRYYKYPSKPVFTGSMNWEIDGSSKTTSFSFSDLTFDYDNMPATITSFSPITQRNAVAKICAAASVASKSLLMEDGTGAFDCDAMVAYYDVFGYSKASLETVYRDCYATQEEWDQLLYNEIMAGRPVQMGALSSSDNYAHAFILDGIDEKGYLHVNWGWGGTSNGFYAIPYMNPSGQGSIYSDDQCAIIGIQKPQSDDEVLKQTSVMSFIPLAVGQNSISRDDAFLVYMGEFYNYYTFPHTFTLGVGLFNKEGQLVENVCQLSSEDLTVAFDGFVGLIDTIGAIGGSGLECRIPATCPDGAYTLRLITKEKGYTEWREPDVVGGRALNRVPVVVKSTQVLFNENASSIGRVETETSADLSSGQYYSIDGIHITRPQSGQVYLERKTSSQGKVSVVKRVMTK